MIGVSYLLAMFLLTGKCLSETGYPEIAEANTHFAISVLQSFDQDDANNNQVLSPWSLSLTFAMLSEGAKGPSLQEILRVFHWDNLHGKLREAISKTLRAMTDSQSANVTLHLASRLWVDREMDINPAFSANINDVCQATLGKVSFKEDPKEALTTINKWIAEKTDGNIKKLFPDGALDSNTRLVLSNAVHFKGKWKNSFSKKDTKKMIFHTSRGAKKVDTMYIQGNFTSAYSAKYGCKLLALPYAGNSQDMIIVLPLRGKTLSQMLRGLPGEMLTKMIASMTPSNMEVFLPRFHLHAKYQLGRVLSKLGLQSIFGPTADLSGITGHKDLFVSAAIHETDVEVNEEGTTASSATGIGVSILSMPKQFTVDHPFLFVIREQNTGLLSFSGVVNDPTKA